MYKIAFATCLLFSISDCPTVVAGLIDTVLIGNPGNAGRPVTPEETDDERWYKFGVFGSVSREYRIGTTEVTNDQYVTFLSAVASTDPRSLFNTSMQSNPRGGIQRTGTSGNYSYSSKPSMGNKPVNFVSIWDAMRFSNWLHNDMPNGNQDLSTTEDGAYFLNGVTFPPLADRNVTRKAGAKWFLPSDDEWFKAAYHKNDGITGNFYEYPTATDDEPIPATADAQGNVSNPGSNVANYLRAADWNGLNGNVTTVGSTQSPSAYGTFDQAGNVDEMTETMIFCVPEGCPEGPAVEGESYTIAPIVRGGTWRDANDFHIVGIENSNRDIIGFNGGHNVIGFRVATAILDSADFNSDTFVNEQDLQLWEQGFGNSIAGDADHDGDTDGADFLIWQRQFSTNAVSIAVPEPTTLVLVLMFLAGSGCASRKKTARASVGHAR